MSTILQISDMHIPAQHPDALEFLKGIKKHFQPDVVVCTGDLTDSAALSRFVKNPDLPQSGDELEETLDYLARLYRLFPTMIICNDSNHDDRLEKRALEAGIPKAMIKSFREWAKFPQGWTIKNKPVIDKIMFTHGQQFGGVNVARTAAIHYAMNVVLGHHHSQAGVSWINNGNKVYFGVAGGCLINPRHDAMAYGAHSKNKPMIGTTVIFDGIPSWIKL